MTATLTSLGENPPSKVGFSMGTLAGDLQHRPANDNAVVTTVLSGTVSTLQGALCVSVYDTGALAEFGDYTFHGVASVRVVRLERTSRSLGL